MFINVNKLLTNNKYTKSPFQGNGVVFSGKAMYSQISPINNVIINIIQICKGVNSRGLYLPQVGRTKIVSCIIEIWRLLVTSCHGSLSESHFIIHSAMFKYTIIDLFCFLLGTATLAGTKCDRKKETYNISQHFISIKLTQLHRRSPFQCC